MRIGIVGAGAVGGFFGALLASSGQDVTLFDKPDVIEPIAKRGLTILGESSDRPSTTTCFRATADLSVAGVQDVVIFATRADTMRDAAPFVAGMCAGHTSVVTVQNGLPWWYFSGASEREFPPTLKSLDPTGAISQHIDPARIIGCVVYPALEVIEPGVIRHFYGSRVPIGEADGTISSRVQILSRTLESAGLRSRVLTDIRSELWLKALGACVLNPVSVLTRATLAGMCNDPHLRQTIYSAMFEAQSVAHALGIRFRRTIDERIAGAASVGEHKTSMLQAFEAGLPLELDATTGIVCELGRLTRTPAPLLETIYACTKVLAERVGCGS